MRKTFSILLLFTFTLSYSAEKKDSTKSKLHFSGNVSLNTNGIAPIPAFSLGTPAIIAALTLEKKRFSYDPTVAYGINMRPWLIDNWLRYRLVFKPKFELRAGFNFSMLFSEYDTGEDKILQGQQYLTMEIAGIYKMSPESSFTLMYWNDHGQDPGSLNGNYYNIAYDRTNINIGKSLIFYTNIQVFYIDYTGANDGLFVSPKIASSLKDLPISIFFQATQAITSNIVPFPGFRWNAGVAYLF
jgi:hypothetical protein